MSHVLKERELQFRVEFFNIANRANFGLPDGKVRDEDGDINPDVGRIYETVTTSRQIQFGLRFQF